MERGLYEGRRGSKRLKAIEKYKEKILEEFNNEYEMSPEMRRLREEIRWDETAELIFLMAMRDVHFTWNGIRDYGFIKLCIEWIDDEKISVLTPKSVATMIRAVLPENMCQELSEELSALEIF